MTGPVSAGRRPGSSFGCLGTLMAFVVVTAIVVLALFVGFVALGIVAALLVIGLLALAVDRILLTLSPKRRERRRTRQSRVVIWRSGQFGPGEVIDTSVIDTTATEGRDPIEGPDQLGSDEDGPGSEPEGSEP